jgi:hypothetical protein
VAQRSSDCFGQSDVRLGSRLNGRIARRSEADRARAGPNAPQKSVRFTVPSDSRASAGYPSVGCHLSISMSSGMWFGNRGQYRV